MDGGRRVGRRSCTGRWLAPLLAALLLPLPAAAVTETVDIELPAGTTSGAGPAPPAAVDAPEPDEPALVLPQADVEPLDITPEWDIKGFDVTQYRVPTDNAALVGYLSENYVPCDEELSLYAAIALALRYNHDLNRRRLEAAAACAGIDINWADLRPQLSVNARSFVDDSRGGQTGTGTGTDTGTDSELTHQLALNLTQRIYDWGLSENLIERDRAQFAVRVHTVEMAEQVLVYDVTSAYYGFTLALGQLRVRQDALLLSREFLRQTQIQFDVGTVPRLDVIRAEARVETAQNDVTNAQADLGDAAARFFSLLGVDYQNYVPAVVSAELLELGFDPPVLDDAIEVGINNRPEIDVQFATLLAGESAVRLARNRPLLEGYANTLLRAPVSGFQPSENYELGVQLLWNAYTGGREKAERRQAELNVKAISEGLLDIEDQVQLDVTTAWNALVANRASVGAARRNLDLSAEALRAASVGYSAGVTPYIEFQDALDRNIAAALDYLAALVNVKIAEANLDRATGFAAGYPGGLTAELCAEIGNEALAEMQAAQGSTAPATAPPAGGKLEPMPADEPRRPKTSAGEPLGWD
jgi:outer membrane protein